MAKQKGSIIMEGALGELSFYKRSSAYLVRTKGGPTRNQFKRSKRFERSRECSNEFATATQTLKLLKAGWQPELKQVCDLSFYGRLTALLMQVLRTDSVHERGVRRVEYGDLNLLKGFCSIKNFSHSAIVTTSQKSKNTVHVQVTRRDHYTSTEAGATHYQISSYLSACDPLKQTNRTEKVCSKFLTLGEVQEVFNTDHLLSQDVLNVHSIAILFYQQVNGEMYFIKSGSVLFINAIY